MAFLKGMWDVLKNVATLSASEDKRKYLNELNSKDEEIKNLKEEIENLKKKLELKESLSFIDGAYWTKDGKGPYCSVCYENNNKCITTIKKPGHTKMQCPVCKHEYSTSEQMQESKEVEDMIFRTIYDDGYDKHNDNDIFY